jgi:carbon monoxide dehydrogenase subunit G
VEFKGRYVIPAPPETVWEALNDPAVLKTCIPGCGSLEKLDPTKFAASARLKIGPMSATFKGNVTLSDLERPRRCVLKGEGQGGVAGFAKGLAEVFLAPEADGTLLTYSAKATVGGKLAQIGQRLIDGAARQIADDFFSRFVSEVTAMKVSASPTPETALAPPPQLLLESTPQPPVREGLAPEIWVVGLVAIIVILLILFGLVL